MVSILAEPDTYRRSRITSSRVCRGVQHHEEPVAFGDGGLYVHVGLAVPETKAALECRLAVSRNSYVSCWREIPNLFLDLSGIWVTIVCMPDALVFP